MAFCINNNQKMLKCESNDYLPIKINKTNINYRLKLFFIDTNMIISNKDAFILPDYITSYLWYLISTFQSSLIIDENNNKINTNNFHFIIKNNKCINISFELTKTINNKIKIVVLIDNQNYITEYPIYYRCNKIKLSNFELLDDILNKIDIDQYHDIDHNQYRELINENKVCNYNYSSFLKTVISEEGLYYC